MMVDALMRCLPNCTLVLCKLDFQRYYDLITVASLVISAEPDIPVCDSAKLWDLHDCTEWEAGSKV